VKSSQAFQKSVPISQGMNLWQFRLPALLGCKDKRPK
jgi:hypothetical protein